MVRVKSHEDHYLVSLSHRFISRPLFWRYNFSVSMFETDVLARDKEKALKRAKEKSVVGNREDRKRGLQIHLASGRFRKGVEGL